MSGDQTSYIRAKMAERGQAVATFMKDGFTKWAESEAPAREGQMEKTPANVQMASTGGAMSVAKAKRLCKSLGYTGGYRVPTTSIGVRRGGRSILGIQIPDEVEKYIGYAEKFADLVDKVSARLPAIKEDLEDNVIDNNDDPSIGPKDKEVARELLKILQAATAYVTTIKRIVDIARDIAKLVGSGSGIRGGATAVETLTKMINNIKRFGKILADWVGKFVKYKNFIRPMLNLRSLQPEGKLLLERIDPLLQLIGAGRGAKCSCPTKRGGRSITDAVMESVQQPYGTTTYGIAKPSYGQMQPDYGVQQRNIGMFGEDWGPSYGVKQPDYGVMQPDGMFGEMGPSYGVKQSEGMMMGGPSPMSQSRLEQKEAAAQKKKQARIDQESKRQAEALENVRSQTAQSVGDVQKDFFRVKGGRYSSKPPTHSYKGGATTCGGKKPSARGAIVKKVMREQGLSLPQASKYVKEHGLY